MRRFITMMLTLMSVSLGMKADEIKVSNAPVDGVWSEETVWYLIKNEVTGGWLSMGPDYTSSGNMLMTNTTMPPDKYGLWCVVGNAATGYVFYNYATGTGKVYGVTGSEADARSTMVTQGATGYSTKFDYVKHSSNTSGYAVKIHGSANNYWNRRGDYQALWNSSSAVSDDGSTYYFYKIDDVDDINVGGPAEYFQVNGVNSFVPESKHTLWYNLPSTKTGVKNEWMEYSLPIGNGQFGASLFGGVLKDELQFNEKTLWSGKSNISGDHGYYRNFGSVIVKDISGYFSVKSRESVIKPVEDYVRWLDIEKGVGGVRYSSSDKSTTYERRYIASAVDQVVVAHYKATGTDRLQLKIYYEPGEKINASVPVYTSDGEGTFSGALDVVRYNTRFKVQLIGSGSVSCEEDGILVKDADEVMIVLGGKTDYDCHKATFKSGETASVLASYVKTRVESACDKGWEAMYADHVADVQSYLGRVDLQLGQSASSRPTNELITYYNSTTDKTQPDCLFLEEMYFYYGRYLELSSSRGVDVPSNLQGIWNNKAEAPWHSDIHTNINVQMNYWPAETTNLSEMHLPFLNHIIALSTCAPWKEAAQSASYSGQSCGWTVFTESNIFGGMSQWMTNYTIANAWYCSHLWQHYRYTLDRDFLKRAFPAMWSATEFWMERLVKGSDGTWECPNEYSPEHGPSAENATAHSQQLVRELFDDVLQSIDILGDDAGLTDTQIAELKEKYEHLDKGLATELVNGQTLLKEWKYTNQSTVDDYNSHRHLSHLMCLYPFGQVTDGDAFYDAAVKSLEARGDAATGWSLGWKVNLWARAKNGDHAHTILKNAMRHCTSYTTNQYDAGIYYNLYDAHSPFQIDGNFGACAGIAEMLLQSMTGTIEILPALPKVWSSGHVKGLKAVGDFTVDIAWENGYARSLRIENCKGQQCKVKCANLLYATAKVKGEVVELQKAENDVWIIPSNAGDVIDVEIPEPVVKKITWNVTDEAGNVLNTETIDAVSGTSYNTSLQAYKTTLIGNVDAVGSYEDQVINLTYRLDDDYPILFADAFSDVSCWYRLKMDPEGSASYWMYNKSFTNNVYVKNTTADETGKYDWAFVGSPYEGYVIQNKFAGSAYALNTEKNPHTLSKTAISNGSRWDIGEGSVPGSLILKKHNGDGSWCLVVNNSSLYQATKGSNTCIVLEEMPDAIKSVANPQSSVIQPIYDLSGRRIKTPAAKGVYVRGNKKIIM